MTMIKHIYRIVNNEIHSIKIPFLVEYVQRAQQMKSQQLISQIWNSKTRICKENAPNWKRIEYQKMSRMLHSLQLFSF